MQALIGRVSVIIPSLNSPLLDEVIAGLRAQDRSERIDEILVVGRDEPGLLARPGARDPRVRLIDTGHPVNAPTARNLGMREARGDAFVFLDSDCRPDPKWLGAHLDALERGHPVVGGAVSSASGYWKRVYNLAMFSEVWEGTAAGPRHYLPTLNLSVRRSVVDSVGPFDESLDCGEDIDWTARMGEGGFEIYFEPAARVCHDHARGTLASVWQNFARTGAYSRRVRLARSAELSAPPLLRHRWLMFALLPLAALWLTARVVGRVPGVVLRTPLAIPGIVVAKVAWCWGVACGEAVHSSGTLSRRKGRAR